MTKTNTTLRKNPYLTYRDPKTGRWVVEKLGQKSEQKTPTQPKEISNNQNSQFWFE